MEAKNGNELETQASYPPPSSPGASRLRSKKPLVNGCLGQYNCDYNTVRDPKHILFTGTVSGVFVAFFCTPFDVVKNHWQFSSRLESTRTSQTTLAVVRDLVKHQGYRRLWTGLTPTVCLVVPSNILFFSIYESLKDRVGPTVGGVIARTACVTALSPLEMFKTRAQANVGGPSALQAFRQLMNHDGLKFIELWRGAGATLLRDIPFSAVYWTTYERGKKLIARCDKKIEERPKSVTKFLYPFVAGGAAAALSCLLTHPFDVVKTRVQGSDGFYKCSFGHIKQDGLSHRMVNRIIHDEGIMGLTVGLAPRLAKIIPSCSILLATYEFANHMLNEKV